MLLFSFSNITDKTFTGHAALLLWDEHDYRLKRTNVSIRNGEDYSREPFQTLASAWSVNRSERSHGDGAVMLILSRTVLTAAS